MQGKSLTIFITLGGLLLTPIIVARLIKPHAAVVAQHDRDVASVRETAQGIDPQMAKQVEADLKKTQQDEQKRVDQMQKDIE